MSSPTWVAYLVKTALLCTIHCTTLNALDCFDTANKSICNAHVPTCAKVWRPSEAAPELLQCQKTCQACNDNRLLLKKTIGSPERNYYYPHLATFATDGILHNFDGSGELIPLVNCYRSLYDDPPSNNTRSEDRFLCIDTETPMYIHNMTIFLASDLPSPDASPVDSFAHDHTIIYTSLTGSCDTISGRREISKPENLCAEMRQNVSWVWNVSCQKPGNRKYIMIVKPSRQKYIAICEVYIGGGPWRCSMGFAEINNTCVYCHLRCNHTTYRCPEVDTCPTCPTMKKVHKSCFLSCPEHCLNGVCDPWSWYCHKGCALRYWWGNCRNTCPNCLLGCHQITGICTYGKCIPGFWNSSGNCNARCHNNCLGGNCEVLTGECISCSKGRYGRYCESVCPSNCSGGQCIRNGSCVGCSAGYYGNLCDRACNSGCFHNVCSQTDGNCVQVCPGNGLRYGQTCSLSCSPNCISGACEKDSGDCILGCSHGFFTANCSVSCTDACRLRDCVGSESPSCRDQICSQSYFGDRCDRKCPEKCLGVCITYGESFTCPKCRDGLAGDDCSEKCPDGCLSCDQTRAYECFGCQTGRFGDSCEEQCPTACQNDDCFQNGTCRACRSGRWNQTCEFFCDNCDPLECDRYTGICKEGCQVGFYGQHCHDVCPENCEARDCTPAGECRYGCDDDFEGPSCRQKPSGFLVRYWFIILMYLLTGLAVYVTMVRWHQSTDPRIVRKHAVRSYVAKSTTEKQSNSATNLESSSILSVNQPESVLSLQSTSRVSLKKPKLSTSRVSVKQPKSAHTLQSISLVSVRMTKLKRKKNRLIKNLNITS